MNLKFALLAIQTEVTNKNNIKNTNLIYLKILFDGKKSLNKSELNIDNNSTININIHRDSRNVSNHPLLYLILYLLLGILYGDI